MNLEEEREAVKRLLLTTGRQNGKSLMLAEEKLRMVLEVPQEYREAYERLMQMSAECAEAIRDAWVQLAEAFRNILAAADFSSMEMLAKLAEEGVAVPDGREWQRDREREAIPREQARAATRYKAHRRMMAEHKARQHLRRRKYRSGANAGWY